MNLYFLGPPRVERDGAPLEIESAKGLALLAYLAVTGQEHSRDALSTMLWPDSDQSKARSYLRHVLWGLKKHLGSDALSISRQKIGLSQQVHVSLDVADFRETIENAAHHSHSSFGACQQCLEQLQQAVASYRDLFLAGFTLPDAPGFDEWQFFQAEELRQMQAGALRNLVEAHTQRTEYEQAIQYTRQLLSLDVLDEPAHRTLMQLYALSGQVTAALRQYRECRRVLHQELGLEPDEETRHLYETIKENRGLEESKALFSTFSPSNALRGQPGGSVRVPGLEEILSGLETSEDVRLFAREQEISWLRDRLAGSGAPGFGIFFVSGEAGQGKTALLQEFSRQAANDDEDLIVAGGTCNAYTGLGDPYSPFREILEQLTGDIASRVAAGKITRSQAQRLWDLFPTTIRILVESAPDLIDTFIPAQGLLNRVAAYSPVEGTWWGPLQALIAGKRNEIAASGLQQAALFDQYTRLLAALAEQAPLLLILDDLQWADGGSMDLLFELGRKLAGQRVFIAGAYRTSEISMQDDGMPHPLDRIINELRSELGEIVLDLNQAPGRKFINDLLDDQPNWLGDEFRETLYRQTGGHPLFTIELLRGMQERGDLLMDESGRRIAQPDLDWDQLPARVEGAIGARISRLSPPLLELLQTASIEGEEFTAEAVARALNADQRTVVRQLSGDLDKKHRLVAVLGIKRVSSGRLSRYRFRHNLIQRFLYNLQDDVERAYQHEMIGNALESLYGERAAEIAAQLVRHFQAARMPVRAAYYARRAGEQARRAAAFGEAIRYFQSALGGWPDDDPHGRAEILQHLGESLWMKARLTEAVDALNEAFALDEKLGLTEGAGAAQRLLGRIYWELGEGERSMQHYFKALKILEAGPENLEMARTVSRISGMFMIASDYSQAIAWGERALEMAARLQAEDVVIHALNNVGSSHFYLGQPEMGQQMLEESADRARKLNLAHDVCRAYQNMGAGGISFGYYSQAKFALESLEEYAGNAGVPLYWHSSQVEQTRLEWLTGDWITAQQRVPQIEAWLHEGRKLGWVDVELIALLGLIYNDLGLSRRAYEVLGAGMDKVKGFSEPQFVLPSLTMMLRAIASCDREGEAAAMAEEIFEWLNRDTHAPAANTEAAMVLCHWLVENPESDLLAKIGAILEKQESMIAPLKNVKMQASLDEAFGCWHLARGQDSSAAERFRQAAAGWQRIHRPLDRASSLANLGHILRRTGEAEQARLANQQALDLLESLSCQLLDPSQRTSFETSPLFQQVAGVGRL